MQTPKQLVALTMALALPAAGLAASAAASPASNNQSDTSYHVRMLEPLDGGNAAFGAGLTNSGLISGTSSTATGTTHAILWDDGELKDLGTLGGPDASSAVLWPVKNNSGVVVGVSQTDEVDPHNESWSCGAFLPERLGYACVGFVWRDGTMRPLPTLGGTHGFAAGLNNRGQIVGWAENTVRDSTCTGGQVLQFRAVRWDALGRRTTELAPLPGDTVSAATAINDAGRVVGISGLCDQAVGRLSARHAVVWDSGRPRLLPDLGGIAWNTPMALNHRGDAVGFVNRSAADGQSFRPLPVMWTGDGSLRKLEVPEGHFGQALGINARREVVGVVYTPGFQQCTAVVWRNAQMTVLQAGAGNTSLDLCSANDINDRGQITGQATDRDTGETVGFLATPTTD